MGVGMAIVLALAGCTADGPDKSDDSSQAASSTPVACFQIRTEEHPCPGIELSIRLSADTVPSGSSIKGRLVFRNTNEFPVEVDGDQPEVAYFRDPEGGGRVGGHQGFIAGTGWGAILGPGESASLPLTVAAVELPGSSGRALGGKQPPLAPGNYVLTASTASCNLDEGGECRRMPPAETPITVVAR